MDYKKEIESLQDCINYTKEQIELDKKYNKEGIWKLEGSLKPMQILIELFKKFEALPKDALEVPCKTIGFYLDYDCGRISVQFSFKEGVWGGLYDYICDSYSEWHIQKDNLIKAMLYNICDIPSLYVQDENGVYMTDILVKYCDEFYDRVLRFVNFFKQDKVGQAVLESIDHYYNGIVEAAKNEFE